MSVKDGTAATWARASIVDTRLTNHELKFSCAIFNESAYSYYIREPTSGNRPRTADANRLKRRHAGGDATAKPKKRKAKETTSKELTEKVKENTIDSSRHLERKGSPTETPLHKTGIPINVAAPKVQPTEPRNESPDEVNPSTAAPKIPSAPGEKSDTTAISLFEQRNKYKATALLSTPSTCPRPLIVHLDPTESRYLPFPDPNAASVAALDTPCYTPVWVNLYLLRHGETTAHFLSRFECLDRQSPDESRLGHPIP